MRFSLRGLNVRLGTGMLLGVALAHAGTIDGLDDPGRTPSVFIVVLKLDPDASLKNLALTDAQEVSAKSDKWRVAKAAADRAVTKIVDRLVQAHPQVKISAVLSSGQTPGFVMKASDADAEAIANEDDVAEVDTDSVLQNVTSANTPEPLRKRS